MNTPSTRPVSLLRGAKIRLDCGLVGTVHQLWRIAVHRGSTVGEHTFEGRIKCGWRDMEKLMAPARRHGPRKKDNTELAAAIAAVNARRLTRK